MLVFACISPHAPIFLPTVGSRIDRDKVKSTISGLESLAPKLAETKPDLIIISSPHEDWGINVPLHFLMINHKYQMTNKLQIANDQLIIEKLKNLFENLTFDIYHSVVFPVLTTLDFPRDHYRWGQEIVRIIPEKLRVAWIASGDMSHTLKEDGPYGFNPAGPEYDQRFIGLLKNKDVEGILKLDSDTDWLNQAGQCGLNSFCMLLGALEESKTNWTPDILSYEGPFGVGYLVANFRIRNY